MELGLKGRRVLITGATGGLGGGMAGAFAAEGARIVVHGRNRDRAEALARDLPDAAVVLGDLGKPDEADAVAAAVAADGGVDVLVNNAGGDGELAKGWNDLAPAEWSAMFDAEVVGAARMVRACTPAMADKGWGRVLFISAGAAVRPFPIGAHYAAAKAALSNMAVSLAQAMGGAGITSNAIVCGPIHTPGIEAIWTRMAPAHGWGDTWDEIESNAVRQFTPNPLARLGRIEELAAAAVFLCSAPASFINGATLRVDGGALGVV